MDALIVVLECTFPYLSKKQVLCLGSVNAAVQDATESYWKSTYVHLMYSCYVYQYFLYTVQLFNSKFTTTPEWDVKLKPEMTWKKVK